MVNENSFTYNTYFVICLGSMRNQNFDISSVPLHLSTSSGSPDEFSYVSPGSQILVDDPEFYLMVEQVICPLPGGGH